MGSIVISIVSGKAVLLKRENVVPGLRAGELGPPMGQRSGAGVERNDSARPGSLGLADGECLAQQIGLLPAQPASFAGAHCGIEDENGGEDGQALDGAWRDMDRAAIVE